METLDILSDADLLHAIAQGDHEIRHEETSALDEVAIALVARSQAP